MGKVRFQVNNSFKEISLIIPVFNEENSIVELVNRIYESFNKSNINYELIFVDDHSTDNTEKVVNYLSGFHPIILIKKKGKRGKAYSIKEGIDSAKFGVVGMIDADLQYPPESIPEMLIHLKNSDIVIANRKKYEASNSRKLFSKTFRYVFGKRLFGLNHDIQSGLKIFKKEIINTIKFNPSSAWTFDLEFLHRATQAGYKISDFDIVFAKRTNGKSKVGFVGQTLEIGLNALKLKTKRIHPAHIPPTNGKSMAGAGIGYNKKKYITHTTIPHNLSALKTFTISHKIIILLILVFAAFGFYINPLLALKIIVGTLTAIYFADVLFNLYLISRSLSAPREINSTDDEINNLDEASLPVYSILCPLYKEAQIIPQFLEAIGKISWPKEKLDVILLLEEDDVETIQTARNMNLPSYVRILVVPHSFPKTKPKACNYGLAHAKGEYLVIYDAEDIPDPLQLKKAYLGFGKADKDTICLQAKLNYYNPHQNLLTRFFTAEYSLWFDVTLPGLQSFNTALPLGGTSNHFKTINLREVGGWDPFNVTEDADLGVRLFKRGYKTAMIDSVTLEEANSNVKNWFRQRSRWIKGYMQTYLVHTRGHRPDIRNSHHSLIFQLVIGGKVAFVLINPLLWIATFSYFALYAYVGPAIEAIYPSIVFYMAITSLVLGNFLFLYYYMIGVAKKNQWNLIKFVFLIPIYWFMISISAMIALYQLIFKPHYWEKTVHGLHLQKPKIKTAEVKKPVEVTDEDFGFREEAVVNVSPSFQIQNHQSKVKKRNYNFRISPYGYFGGAFLITATILSNFLNFLYNVYLGRSVTVEQFGLIALIGGIQSLSEIPLNGLSRAVTYKSAYLFGKYDAPVKKFWSSTRNRAVIISLAVASLWVILTPLIANFFKSDGNLPILLFTPVWVLGVMASVDGGFLRGNHRFALLASASILEASAKFLSTFLLVNFGFENYVYAALPISMTFTFLVLWISARRTKAKEIKMRVESVVSFPWKFYGTSILLKVSTVAYVSSDIILAKHFLSPVQAGQYALLSLSGKMVYFAGSLFSQFLLPLVSHKEGAGKDSKNVFSKLILASGLSSFGAFIVIGIFGSYVVPLVFGDRANAIVEYLPLYCLAMVAFTISTNIVTYHQIKNQHFLSFVSFVLALVQIGALYLFHSSIRDFAVVMTALGIANLVIALAIHYVHGYITSFGKNLKDLFSESENSKPIPTEGARILIFNWRDTKHKWAGGAEAYIHEIAKRWVEKGHAVTLFAGNDGKLKKHEKIDGINIVRRGGTYTVYPWAFLYYVLKFKGKFDVVVDSENGIPFFTSLYAREKVLLIVYHIHQEVFREHLRFPLSSIARFLEGNLMPRAYKRNQIITISESSKNDIVKLGLGKNNNISIVHPGHEASLFSKNKKSKTPMFTYVGRLKPYKNVDVAIKAFSQVVKVHKDATLLIIGEGEAMDSLKKLVKELGIIKNVIFTGKVTDIQKANLLAKSWVALQPSMVEGWGITVIESNASGTPVIASNVNGLRDSVVHGQTGTLVPVGDVDAFATAMIDFIINDKYRNEISNNAHDWSQNFSWEKSSEKFMEIINLTNDIAKPKLMSIKNYVLSK